MKHSDEEETPLALHTTKHKSGDHAAPVGMAAQRKITRRGFLRATGRFTVVSLGATAGSGAWARKVEPGWIDIENVSLTLPRLPRSFDGYRLVHVSDLHVDGWMNEARLEHVVQLINRQQPDAVAITGDFVTRYDEVWGDILVNVLPGLKAKDGVYGVLGNHDHWWKPNYVSKAISDGNVHELANSVHSIKRGTDRLHLCGVDDVWEKAHDLPLVLQQLDKRPVGCAVLLAHEPDFADESSKHDRFDLQLSGHSHGGQVRVPFFGSPILPKLGQKYYSGHYQVGTLQQYTTRGVGNVGPRLRFNCRPEITVLTLRSPIV
jgi:predicted MPP superfamily phosphohydrolase